MLYCTFILQDTVALRREGCSSFSGCVLITNTLLVSPHSGLVTLGNLGFAGNHDIIPVHRHLRLLQEEEMVCLLGWEYIPTPAPVMRFIHLRPSLPTYCCQARQKHIFYSFKDAHE